MKLADLNPEFVRGLCGKGYLSFDCPVCGPSHRVVNMPTFDEEPRDTGICRWGLKGNPPDWDTVSLQPSINYDDGHWHGYLTNGEFIPVP